MSELTIAEKTRALRDDHLFSHLTDGAWHDSCPFCLQRRLISGTGVTLSDQKYFAARAAQAVNE